MKLISLISTVLNEENNIKDFLECLINQSVLPDEIIIVDGGSRDKTYDILKEYEKGYPNLIKVFRKEGYNIAQGRNFAIKNSEGIIIVVADVGCLYERDYVKKMTAPLIKYMINNLERFNINKKELLRYVRSKGYELDNVEEGEFVQGYYYPYYSNDLGFYAGFFLVKEKQCKIPSRASAKVSSYFKYVWERVGGYPESFITGEDTKFNILVLRNNFKWVCVSTEVLWKMPESLLEFYKKFEKYAIGDAIQGNLFDSPKLLLFFVGFWIYVILVVFYPILLLLSLIYLIAKGLIYFIRIKRLKSLVYIPVLEVVRVVAYQIGIIKGLIKGYLK